MASGTISTGATRKRQARLLLVGTTLFWGLSFPLLRGLQLAQEAIVPGVPDRVLASADVILRFGLSALILLPFCARDLLNVTRREWSQAVGLALFGGVGLFLQTLGLAWTDASLAAFLTQLYTLIVPLIVAVRDRRWPTLRIVLACALVLAGAAILSPGLLTRLTLGPGEIIILISTVLLAGMIVWVERPLYAQNRPTVVTLIMFALFAAISGLLFPLVGGTIEMGRQVFDSQVIWGLILVLALLCTVFTFFIMNAWQRFISASEAGLIYCLEPVIATVFCAFVPGWISRFGAIRYPNETLRWELLVGGSLIVGATVLAATQQRPVSPIDDPILTTAPAVPPVRRVSQTPTKSP